MIKKYLQHPHVILLLLFTIHYIAAYPGGMTSDSEDQFNQSLTLQFNSHHPPIMAMLWSVFNLVYAGPQIMLFFHLSLLWLAIWFLFQSDENNKFRWLYFVIPFSPGVFAVSGMIWKDVGFANCFFFIFAFGVYYICKKQKPPRYILTIVLLIALYGTMVKFQAKFIIPILVLFVTFALYEPWTKRILTSFILSATIILTNSLFIRYLSTDTHSEQMRQLFDLAGIAVDIDSDDIFPNYIKDDPLYSFEKVKEYYTPRSIDPFVFHQETVVFKSTQNEYNLSKLNDSFYNAIKQHPLSYLKHRAKNFKFLLFSTQKLFTLDARFYLEDSKYKFHIIENNILQRFFISYIEKVPKNILKNITPIILLIFCISLMLWLMQNKECKYSSEPIVLAFLFSVSVIFSVTLFFTIMASDYRYFTLVRIMVFGSLPIFLNFLYKQIMHLINIPQNKIYKGYDIVTSVIDKNIKYFAKDNVTFNDNTNTDNIDDVDLLIIKDVLMHWLNKRVQYFIDNILPKFKYALITERDDESLVNTNIDFGEWRPVDLISSPFYVPNIENTQIYGASGVIKKIYFYKNSNND